MDLKQKLFEIRSYTPIPFILIAIIFAEPTFETLSIGFAIAIIGESIRFWGVSICGSETRTTGAVGATNLVTDGPFGFVRNPLYVGNILMYVGCSFMSNSIYPWLQITTAIYFIFQYHIIVLKEEEYLRKVFKEEYSNYEKNVPRFFPRLTKIYWQSFVSPKSRFVSRTKIGIANATIFYFNQRNNVVSIF